MSEEIINERRELRLSDCSTLMVASQEQPDDCVEITITESGEVSTFILGRSDMRMLMGFFEGALP